MPTDKDVMEGILKEVGLGFLLRMPEAVLMRLTESDPYMKMVKLRFFPKRQKKKSAKIIPGLIKMSKISILFE